MFVKIDNPTADRATLSAAAKLLERFSADLDADVLEPGFATDILSEVCRLEKLCTGIKTLVSLRATAASGWKAKGERSAAHWLARRTGKSVTDAATLLETAERVNHLPQTQQALRKGTISEDHAKHIASAAGSNSDLEGDLLNSATSEGFGSFVQRCNKLKAAAGDQSQRHCKIYARRYLRKWIDPQGAFRLDGCFTPEHGAEIWAALAPYRHQAFQDSRARDIKAPFDAYAADALLAMSRDVRQEQFAAECDEITELNGSDHALSQSGDPAEYDAAEYDAALQTQGAESDGPAGCDDAAPHGEDDGPGELITASQTRTSVTSQGRGGEVVLARSESRAPGQGGCTDTAHKHDFSCESQTPRAQTPSTLATNPRRRPNHRGRKRNRPPVTIDILVDYSALIRGNALPGETCEIEGIGPVPVETVRALQNDAYLWVLLTDGHDIKSVSRMGRYISPRLRKALFVRDRKCVVPGCDAKDHLQIDHRQPVSQQGPTALDNLALLCGHHHDLKTYHGFELSGSPGDWSWRRRGELALTGAEAGN